MNKTFLVIGIIGFIFGIYNLSDEKQIKLHYSDMLQEELLQKDIGSETLLVVHTEKDNPKWYLFKLIRIDEKDKFTKKEWLSVLEIYQGLWDKRYITNVNRETGNEGK